MIPSRTIIGLVTFSLSSTVLSHNFETTIAEYEPKTSPYTRAVRVSELLLENGENICPSCGYVILSDDQESLSIQVKGGYEYLSGKALDIFKENQDIIHIIDSPFSFQELADAFETVQATAAARIGLVEASINPIAQEIEISLNTGSVLTEMSTEEREFIPEVLHGKPPVPVNTVFSSFAVHPTAGRNYDSAPFYMGAQISGNKRCSLGIPVTIDGLKGVITAGHCLNGEFSTADYKVKVGKTYYSMYDARAPQDWQVLIGSKYVNRVFNTPADSNKIDSYEIADVHLKPLAINRQLCASGFRTGQTCRYYVTSTNATANYEGRSFSRLTKTTHRSDKTHDCNGFYHGDSGGPAYYNSGNGKMNVYGIVSAFGTDTSSGGCAYYFTPLNLVNENQHRITFLQDTP